MNENPNQQTVLGRISGILVVLGLCPLVVLGTFALHPDQP